MKDKEHEITTSLTKGCFLFKPNKDETIPSKKRRKNSSAAQLSAEEFYSKFPKESVEDRSQRFITYQNCWNDLQGKINEVQQVLNEKVLDDLLQFVSNSHTKQQKYPIAEIPTAALVTGVNVPDHGVVFSQFASKLEYHLTALVAQLQAKDCPNLKSMLKSVFDRLVNASQKEDTPIEELDESLEADNLNVSKTSLVKKVFKDYTFEELQEWYSRKCKLNLSEIIHNDVIEVITTDNSFQQQFSDKPPLVIILEDFERFSPSVLQDFILIASEYITTLPITLIFGVATSISAVHRSLPPLVSSRLSIEKFQALPSLVSLTEIIDKVMITDANAFKLGPLVFRLLYEHFLYHDFSISNFVRGLEFSVMEHFYGSPFTILCTRDEEFKEKYIKSCTMEKINQFKMIESFSKFLDKKSQSEQTKMKKNLSYCKNIIMELFIDLRQKESLFYPVVNCLHQLTATLPAAPFGKRLRDTYEYCAISHDITKEKKYKHAMTLVRLLSRDELLPIVSSCQNILVMSVAANEDCSELEQVVQLLDDFIERFENLDNIVLEECDPVVKETTPKQAVFKNRYEFQEKLKKAVKEKRKESPYEKLRNEVVDTFDVLFKNHLQSPLSLPFHEIFYYNDMLDVKEGLNGSPRTAIQQALSIPNSYLKCNCCPPVFDLIQDTMPDICILYKLHLECGKMINLYDWLQAFITVIDPSLTDTKKKKSKQKKKLEEQLQARFIRGISELQFLGFIKSTKRKTDHVSRLTWGGC